MRAWAGVANQRSHWRLTLAGYDDAHYRATLETLAQELNVRDRVIFSDPVEDAQREAFFAGVDVIVLPSTAENFGFVVPEALVRGVPVIATHGTPWSALAAERCGWWVPATDEALEAALIEAGDCTPETLDAMGKRGLHVARARFDWDRVTERMMTVYAWMQGTADRPADVQVNA
jgi:glycosyltransferase involved in cell wall biosynthesis